MPWPQEFASCLESQGRSLLLLPSGRGREVMLKYSGSLGTCALQVAPATASPWRRKSKQERLGAGNVCSGLFGILRAIKLSLSLPLFPSLVQETIESRKLRVTVNKEPRADAAERGRELLVFTSPSTSQGGSKDIRSWSTGRVVISLINL